MVRGENKRGKGSDKKLWRGCILRQAKFETGIMREKMGIGDSRRPEVLMFWKRGGKLG